MSVYLYCMSADGDNSESVGRGAARPARAWPHPLGMFLGCRWAVVIVMAAAAAQVLLVAAGLTAWECPLRSVTGIPCPGCGFSRACAALVCGHWRHALVLHAFAFVVPPILALSVLSLILPHRSRDHLVRWVATCERRTGVTSLVVVGYVVYYAARMLIFPGTFVATVCG